MTQLFNIIYENIKITHSNPDSEFLDALEKEDQRERNNYKKFVETEMGGNYNTGAKEWAKRMNRPLNDVFNDSERLKKFMEYPFRFQTFSKNDWERFWILSQHCDDSIKFQQWALQVIEQYLGKKSSHYKYLYDRIAINSGNEQKYGTQNRG